MSYTYQHGRKGTPVYAGGDTLNSLLKSPRYWHLFYSKIDHTILSVNNVLYDSVRHVWQSQLQNTGRSEYLGGEAGVEYRSLQPVRSCC